jgi:periplasmic protein TonB
MIAPHPESPSDAPRRPRSSLSDPGALSSCHYPRRRRSRLAFALAIAISAAVHGAIFFGFERPKKKPAPPPEKELIALKLVMPDMKELEEPEPEQVSDEADPKPDLSSYFPVQVDVPQLVTSTDFVQQLDFSSLVERPDLSNVKAWTIPENIRRGGKASDRFGKIFDLADLDRAPEAVVQPSPLYPSSMKREGLTATVVVEFIVDPQGRIQNAVVIESTHSGFEDAALAGVQKWKFRAGVRVGRKVSTRLRVPIVFTVVDTTS